MSPPTSKKLAGKQTDFKDHVRGAPLYVAFRDALQAPWSEAEKLPCFQSPAKENELKLKIREMGCYNWLRLEHLKRGKMDICPD